MDVALTREEDEDVAFLVVADNFADDLRGGFDVVALVLVRGWPVEGFHGIHSSGHFDDGRVAEGLGKAGLIDGSRGDNDFKILTPFGELAEATEDEVDVEATLVGFIDNDRFVGTEQGVVLQLVEQDTIGHDFDDRVRLSLVGKADLGTHFPPVLHAKLLGDPLGDGEGCDAAGLRAAEEALLPEPAF